LNHSAPSLKVTEEKRYQNNEKVTETNKQTPKQPGSYWLLVLKQPKLPKFKKVSKLNKNLLKN
jgi:hypothetical protein